MTCSCCGSENSPEAHFCSQCGERLGAVCAHCGAPLPEAARFCPGCGRSAQEGPAPEPGAIDEDGERRHLTVMFCDLADSTPLAEGLDPEDVLSVMRSYHDCCTRVIEQYEGHIAQYLGDGVLVYYGYPCAHEDDAQRAVRSALGILEEVGRLSARLERERGIALAVRIGLHSGPVVVGETGGGGGDWLGFGHTVNLAARLQARAGASTVVTSDDTLALVRGLFVTDDLGELELRGIAQPVRVHRVLRASGVRSRFDVAAASRLTPLVGRRHDLGLLLDRWEMAREGRGQVVLVRGEAGLGKSRLMEELRTGLEDDVHTWLDCRASAYHTQSAFHPVIEILERGLLFRPDDTVDDKLEKLTRALESAGFVLPEVLPIFTALLSLPVPEGLELPAASPTLLRRRTLEALGHWVFGLAKLQPMVLAVEDLHWMDPSTLEFLDQLVEQLSMEPVLLVLTFRPSFLPPWQQRSNVSQVALNPLTREQTREMMAGVLGGREIPSEIAEQIVDKTDGVPLFVEEFARTLLESGWLREREGRYEPAAALSSIAIPETLRDSLAARLDRLAHVKRVAQLGATLGREFSHDLLAAISPLDEPALGDALRQLVESEILDRRGAPPRATYRFRHALIQDAAYDSLLRSTRKQVHRRIATVLCEGFPQLAETEPEVVAWHFEQAALPEEAIAHYQQAGQRAAARSAHVEAASHLGRAIELLGELPDEPARGQRELLLRLALGVELIATKGYASPDVARTVTRARELCDALGFTPQLFPVLRGLCAFYATRADYATTMDLARRLLGLAAEADSPDLRLQANEVYGVTAVFTGEFRAAREHLERADALYGPEPRKRAATYPHDAGVASRSYLAWALWFLGYPERAEAMRRSALDLARTVGHPFSEAFGYACSACLHAFRHEVRGMREDADAAVTLATEHAFPFWLAIGTCLQGWAQARAGELAEGLAVTRRGLAIWDESGTQMGLSFFLMVLADIHRRGGDLDTCSARIDDALAHVDRTGERFWQAELHRARGDLLVERGEEGAEACYREALAVARGQEARVLELRAATSLAGLLRDGGRAAEARELLAGVHGWFREGRETADLRAAAGLLSGLGA